MVKDEEIPADLQTQQLQIKTDSASESSEQISIFFYQGENEHAGGIVITLSSPITYWLYFCSSTHRPLQTSPPAAQEKIWGILRTDGGIKIECNGIVVLELDISPSGCDDEYSDYWTKNVKRILFYSSDTASRQYRLDNPGDYYT